MMRGPIAGLLPSGFRKAEVYDPTFQKESQNFARAAYTPTKSGMFGPIRMSGVSQSSPAQQYAAGIGGGRAAAQGAWAGPKLGFGQQMANVGYESGLGRMWDQWLQQLVGTQRQHQLQQYQTHMTGNQVPLGLLGGLLGG